jgi:glyceraldehyde 3-phosphate dehydrogenase
MATRIGINGFGRIGRNFTRALLQRDSGLDLVAVNDITDTRTSAHLLKYDSVLGVLREEIRAEGDGITVGGDSFKVLAERDPGALPWSDLGVDVVIESTGLFTQREKAAKHLEAGAKKVIISAPAKGEDITIVLGVNDGDYDAAGHDIISNASCTTNCVAPMAKVLFDTFGIEQGFMTTIHAYTNTQRLLDLQHEDLREARSAPINIIPASTGAARALGLVIKEAQGKLNGMAFRVPVPDGSVTDLVCVLSRDVTADEVNEAFAKAASSGSLASVLEYSDEPIVSSDIVGSPASCTFDSPLTMANGKLVKVVGWYDNEWGYSNRLVDLTELVASKL